MAPAGALERTNYRGRRVSLAAGPALAMAASVAGGLGAAGGGRAGVRRGEHGRGEHGSVSAAALVAGLGAGAVGLYDDIAGRRPEHHAKGFQGHRRALREGRVTTGLVKVVGVSAVGLVAASILPTRGAAPGRRRPGRAYRALDVALGAGVIAGTANLVNLLDLRPGRALKASLILAILDVLSGQGPTNHPRSRNVAAGAAGAVAALLADDLAERTMIGDSGANAIGAVLGVAAAARTGLAGRAALLTGIAALTAASERVSFTEVIEATPGLRHLDRLGQAMPRDPLGHRA
jgi:UDP-N-acetylmuramyl pentapeptide phosphotransferase/UDP-N-acetylglucosamine-1-phosphate transferase